MTRSLRTTAALAAVGGVVVLGGCTWPGGADRAAVVNGQVITESSARTVADQVNTAFDLQQPLTTANALDWLISGPFIIKAAEKAGHPVSVQQARSNLTKVDNPTDDTIEVVRANLAYSSMANDPAAGQAIVKEMQTASITVNPRYGKIGPNGGLEPITPNWIVGAS